MTVLCFFSLGDDDGPENDVHQNESTLGLNNLEDGDAENVNLVPEYVENIPEEKDVERIDAEPASLSRKNDEIYVGRWIKFDLYEAALSSGKDTLVARDLLVAVFGEKLREYNYMGKAAHNIKVKTAPPRKAIPEEEKRGIKAALTVWYQRRNIPEAVIRERLHDNNAAWKRAITQKGIDMANANDPEKVARKKLLREQTGAY